jgi:hypothetical protein
MDRNRVYKVVLDGTVAGELWPGKSERFSVEPGAHKVRVKIDFMKSNEMDISAVDGQTVELACRGHSSLLAMFNTVFNRNRYLNLDHMTTEEREQAARVVEGANRPLPRNLNP